MDLPPPNFMKLSTDGSARKSPGSGGVGGVFRDSAGKWLFGFQVRLPHTANLQAELIALRTGLYIAKQLN